MMLPDEIEIERLAHLGLSEIRRQSALYRHGKGVNQVDVEDFADAAALAIARCLRQADGARNCAAYVVRAVRREFFRAWIGYRRGWRRKLVARSLPLSGLIADPVSPFPGPDVVAMFHDEMARRTDVPPAKNAPFKAAELALFREIVEDGPALLAEEIAIRFNRATGRSVVRSTVSRLRKQLGLPRAKAQGLGLSA